MGMDFSVYVGPYMTAWADPELELQRLIEKYEGVLCEGRGELRSGETVRHLIPNYRVSDRQQQFSRREDMPVVSITQDVMDKEIRRFKLHTERFASDLKELNQYEYSIHWGVVCQES
jgi:hypothetical protein